MKLLVTAPAPPNIDQPEGMARHAAALTIARALTGFRSGRIEATPGGLAFTDLDKNRTYDIDASEHDRVILVHQGEPGARHTVYAVGNGEEADDPYLLVPLLDRVDQVAQMAQAFEAEAVERWGEPALVRIVYYLDTFNFLVRLRSGSVLRLGSRNTPTLDGEHISYDYAGRLAAFTFDLPDARAFQGLMGDLLRAAATKVGGFEEL